MKRLLFGLLIVAFGVTALGTPAMADQTALTAGQATRIENTSPILKTLKIGTRIRDLEIGPGNILDMTITPAATTDGITITGTSMTTADAIQITVTDATLNGGNYIKCTDGTTTDFAIGEGGAMDLEGAITWTDGDMTVTEFNLIGKMVCDNDGSAIDSASPRTGIYSYVHHDTTAVVGEAIGLRGRTRIDVDSTSGDSTGGHFQSGCMDGGFTLRSVRGIFVEVVNKTPTTGNKTWTNARGVEINMDLDQGGASNTNTVTNAAGIWLKWNLPTAGTYSTVTNGYGIVIDNEAVGGTGQALDAAIYIDDTSMSGGIYGWDYGIDMSGVSGFTTADIRLNNSVTIESGSGSPDGSLTRPIGSLYIQTDGAVDAQLWVNEDGSTAWGYVDTT